MGHLDILKDWYHRVWIEQDLAAIDDYFAPHVGADGLMPDGQVGPEDFRALVPALTSLVRDLEFTFDKSFETEDWLWAQVSVKALGAHDMREVRTTGHVAMRFQGGKIVEAYNSFDFLTFFSTAGLLPEDVFLLLLSGERLG
ncbi:nuclear transport factor 2 family protein [Frigidibacter sp. SD6-1]|uniref:ester cyclase n=1 Tax=Frigidibacter sp. SD6-1 TaxID=3032581 RepID=UPI0024E00455|nr:nuclear transport factor 2 family protein [Frigidibacter sp. SD6-1]